MGDHRKKESSFTESDKRMGQSKTSKNMFYDQWTNYTQAGSGHTSINTTWYGIVLEQKKDKVRCFHWHQEVHRNISGSTKTERSYLKTSVSVVHYHFVFFAVFFIKKATCHRTSSYKHLGDFSYQTDPEWTLVIAGRLNTWKQISFILFT